jgi:hypothetical protein
MTDGPGPDRGVPPAADKGDVSRAVPAVQDTPVVAV